MRNFLILFFSFLIASYSNAQELNCTITVNADQVNQTNRQIFLTLERALNDFVNKSQWTNRIYNCLLYTSDAADDLA